MTVCPRCRVGHEVDCFFRTSSGEVVGCEACVKSDRTVQERHMGSLRHNNPFSANIFARENALRGPMLYEQQHVAAHAEQTAIELEDKAEAKIREIVREEIATYMEQNNG